MQLQLYLHFPFCKTKCFYCDFCSFASSENQMQNYLEALKKEVAWVSKQYKEAEISTIFMGGGTPSLMDVQSLSKVCHCVKENFQLSSQVEWSIEANPGTVDAAWLQTARNNGINRLSMGVQATQNELLRSIGRIHQSEEALQSIVLAKQAGFENMSVDLMFGLPEQTQAQYLEAIDTMALQGVSHISAYALIVEEGTPLYEKVEKGMVTLPDEDAVADMQCAGIQRLKEHGYFQYEISNFAKEGKACKHNIGYWQGAFYAGIGLAAHGMLPAMGGQIKRTENTSDLQTYLERMEKGKAPRVQETIIHKEEAMFESVMLGLRMVKGVDLIAFQKRFECTLQERYGRVMDELCDQNLAILEDECFALTARGLMIQNAVLLRFMEIS